MGKEHNFNQRGPTIECILRDEFFKKYFEAKAATSNKKDMLRLKKKLSDKGVDFPDYTKEDDWF